jgi:hypothetical protein
LLAALNPPYHRRPNGSASEIRSTPRGQERRSVQAKISRKKGTLSYPAIIRACAIVDDETKRKDHVLTLGVEEEFQMIAVGFGLSEFRKAKANPREVLRSRRMRICQAKKE